MPSDDDPAPEIPHAAEMPGEIAEIPAGARRNRAVEPVVGDDLEEPDGVGA